MAYEKQTWKTGDLITEGKLNHMEDGIKNAGNIDIPVKFGTGEKSAMMIGASTASGGNSFAEGAETTAAGTCSHAEGFRTNASGDYSHAEGLFSPASGYASHAEGNQNLAKGKNSHAEGNYSHAEGDNSHAEGYGTYAYGNQSHAEGNNTIAKHASQHVFGEYNIEDPSTSKTNEKGTYIEIVGNGKITNPISLAYERSNARTLDWNGNEWLAGSLTLGETTVTEEQLKKLLALLNN